MAFIKSREHKFPHCETCLYTYMRGCPCGNNEGNAACLTLYKDIDTWKDIFYGVCGDLQIYEDKKFPKMDELIFVDDICREYGITKKEALWVIGEIRRYRKEHKKGKKNLF